MTSEKSLVMEQRAISQSAAAAGVKSLLLHIQDDTPLIQQYVVELPGALLLFSLLGFGMLFGTFGVVLAAPLAVVTLVLVKRLYGIDALHTATSIPRAANAQEGLV